MSFILHTIFISIVVYVLSGLFLLCYIQNHLKSIGEFIKRYFESVLVVWFVICLLLTGSVRLMYNGTMCERYQVTHQAEGSKYDWVTSTCLLKDPISKRWVAVYNYGRG